jgi:REP element-mobilizing transposase RayT
MFSKGEYYHIYNRGNNKEKLFYKAKNYQFFLDRYKKYLHEVTDTFTYCLLPNHFHFLIRIKNILENNSSVSEKFRRFFISYSQAINKQENRTGSLFQKNLKKKKIHNQNQLIWLVYYIYRNPIHHGLQHTLNYKWSSYNALTSKSKTSLKRKEVFEWFGGKEAFLEFHQQNVNADREVIQGLTFE